MPKTRATTNPVIKLIRKNRGLATKLGEELGITRAAVHGWEAQVPAAHALKVAKFLGLSRHTVRPDLYPKNLASE